MKSKKGVLAGAGLVVCVLGIWIARRESRFEGIELEHIDVVQFKPVGIDPALLALSGKVASEIESSDRISFRPRSDVEPVELGIPLEWDTDPYHDRNWRYNLHAWKFLDPILARYERTKNPHALDRVVAWMEDWYRYHAVKKRETNYSWYDMAVGLRASRLAYVLDQSALGKYHPSREVLRILYSLAIAHIRELTDPKKMSRGNHAYFQISGLDLLCEVLANEPACDGSKEYAKKTLDHLLEIQFTPEGMHTEHSPGYHFFTLTTIRRLKLLDRWASSESRSLIEKAESIGSALVYPDGRIVPVGDSDGSHEASRRRIGLDCVRGVPCDLLTDLSKSGYLTLRSYPNLAPEQASMIFFQAYRNPETTSHKHADELAFVLIERGREIFTDGGKYGYDLDEKALYFRSVDAHNTIGIEGVTFDEKSVRGVGSFLDAPRRTSDGYAFSGAIDRAGLFQQKRTITYRPGTFLRIVDHLRSSASRAYMSRLHLAPSITATVVGRTVELDVGTGSPVVAKLEELDCRLTIVRGRESPRMGWVAIGYRKLAPTWTIEAACPGKDRKIEWNIDLRPSLKILRSVLQKAAGYRHDTN